VHDPGRADTPTARAFVWTAAAAFVLALGYFVYSYQTTFGRVTAGPFDVGSTLWNVVLFSGFALHHSVFAREPLRRWVNRRLPGLERSVYVWVASLLFAAVCWFWRPVAGVIWETDGPLRLALLLLQVGGITLSVFSASIIDVWDLAGINAQRTTPDSQLVPTPDSRRLPSSNAQAEFKSTGPYGLVRHPIYLGWFLIVFAVGTMTMTRFVFAVVSCAYVLIAIPFEERSIRRTSQGAYDRYMKQVPRRLIPGVY
jgi:protein-S-isoprenylcysteine O-methyltransferase Ste14